MFWEWPKSSCMCMMIANAEATGSNPVEAPKTFFSGYFRNCLNCDSLRWSHTNFICIPAVQIISFNDDRHNNFGGSKLDFSNSAATSFGFIPPSRHFQNSYPDPTLLNFQKVTCCLNPASRYQFPNNPTASHQLK